MDSEVVRNKLFRTIRQNELSLFERIVRWRKVDLTLPGAHVLLHFAVSWDQLDIAKWLLAHGCPVNASDNDSYTPWTSALHVAVHRKHNDLVKEMLVRGARVAVRNPIGESPLYVACLAGNVEAIELLLAEEKLAIDLPDDTMHTPLHVAVENASLEIVRLLLQYGANPNVHTNKEDCVGYTPLHLAVMIKNVKITEVLLFHGANVNVIVDVPKEFKNRNSILIHNFTPLHLAVQTGSDEIVDLLMQNKANVQATIRETGLTPLHIAVLLKRENIVLLFSESSEANFLATTRRGENILHLAVESKWYDFVEALVLENSVNINSKTKDGETPLHIAVRLGLLHIVKLLINNNANINVINNWYETPLHTAINLNTEIAKVLLEKGACVNKIDYKNDTPLSMAIKFNDLKTVQLILNHRPCIYTAANKTAANNTLHNFEKNKNMAMLLLDHAFQLFDSINDSSWIEQLIIFNKYNLVQKILHIILSRYSTLENNRKLLHLFISKNNIELVKLLINDGCKLVFKNDEDKKLLDSVIENNSSEMFQLMISNGAKIQDDHIWAAAKFFDMKLIDILIEHQIEINTYDKFGTTVLHFAVWHEHIELVNFLIENKKLLYTITTYSHKNKKESVSLDNIHIKQIVTTPLHIAVIKKNYDLVSTLVENGIHINSKNGLDTTALHSATKNASSLGIIKLLLRSGADINIFDGKNKLPVHYIFHQTCICNDAFRIYYSLPEDCECYIPGDFEEHVMYDLVKIYVKHIVYLSSINKVVHPDNLQILSQFEQFDELQMSCTMEISRMKNEKIFGNVSYHDLLIKKSNALAAYGRNRKIIKKFNTHDYEVEFPLYAEDLKLQMNEAIHRAGLLNKNASILNRLTNINIPQLVLDNIFLYLSTKELLNLSLA